VTIATRLQDRAQRLFYRSPAARRALLLAFARRVRGRGYDIGHLRVYQEADAVGPLQRDEALLMYGLCRVLRPRKVVEMGFLFGHSAFNLLQATGPDAHVYSFDVSQEAAQFARRHFRGIDRFTFVHASQTDISAELVGGGSIDLAFLDASHDLELNKQTFDRLVPLLSDGAVVAVHDTGTWRRDLMGPPHHAFLEESGQELHSLGDRVQHQRDERRFVNWITEERGGFSALHLHTDRVIRHGLTLLQARKPLPVDPESGG